MKILKAVALASLVAIGMALQNKGMIFMSIIPLTIYTHFVFEWMKE